MAIYNSLIAWSNPNSSTLAYSFAMLHKQSFSYLMKGGLSSICMGESEM
jgi:hypothetical protein